MSETQIIHATLVDFNGKGILLRGKSKSGKSDLALRLIADKGAKLVADDMVILCAEDGHVFGQAPENLRGLLEVRGIGIAQLPYIAKSRIFLLADLIDDVSQIERMPKDAQESIFGVEIEQIDLYAKENSAPEKILLKLNGTLVQNRL